MMISKNKNIKINKTHPQCFLLKTTTICMGSDSFLFMLYIWPWNLTLHIQILYLECKQRMQYISYDPTIRGLAKIIFKNHNSQKFRAWRKWYYPTGNIWLQTGWHL